MSLLAPFAHDGRGRVYVCGDGPEVYAYSGVDDSPLWKDFAEGILVGIAISRDVVLGLDSDGTLIRWRIFDGQRMDVTSYEMECRGISVDPHGGFALLGPNGVRIVSPNGLIVDAAIPRATAVARDSSGSRVVVTTEDGRLVWVDPNTGGILGEIAIPAPGHAVAWSSQGAWVVGAADKLLVLASEPTEAAIIAMYAMGGPTESVAVSADGWLLAARVGLQSVVLLTSTSGENLATITYKRTVGAVHFGSDTWLAVALEYADVNRLELGTGRLTRNGPGLGRKTDPWGADVKLDPSQVRGALARARAGGSPVAMQVDRPTVGAYESENPGRPKWVIPVVIGVSAFMCCSCSTCCGLMNYF